MIIRPFAPEDLTALRLQDAQLNMQLEFTPEYGAYLADNPSFTAVSGQDIVACGGVVQIWRNRSLAWMLLSKNAGKHMTPIVKAIKRYLRVDNSRRIEAFADCDFIPGQRMLKLLGFKLEGLCKAVTPDGRDCYLYALVRD